MRIRTGLCVDHGCKGEDYRLCDYCGEHDCHLLEQSHYYNYGLSKRTIRMCLDCMSSNDIRTNGDCCFNHIIGLPKKNGIEKPLYDYQKLIFDNLQSHKHIWIKKATGLGITESVLSTSSSNQ